MYSSPPKTAQALIFGSRRIKRMLPEGYVKEMS